MGAGVPPGLVSAPDPLLVDCGQLSAFVDDDLTVLDALFGQMFAFFRCMRSGHRPDSPSADAVITRVVSGFAIHRRDGAR